MLGELKRTTPDWLRWSQNVNMCVSKQWFTSPPLSPGWTSRKRPGPVLENLWPSAIWGHFFSHLSSLLACWHLCRLPAVCKMWPTRGWPTANRRFGFKSVFSRISECISYFIMFSSHAQHITRIGRRHSFAKFLSLAGDVSNLELLMQMCQNESLDSNVIISLSDRWRLSKELTAT